MTVSEVQLPELPQWLSASLAAGHSALLVRDQPPAGQSAGIVFAVAALATTSLTNFMATHCRGIVSVTADAETALRLGVGFANRLHDHVRRRRFLVSVEAAACNSTGISAADRALTLRSFGAPMARAGDLVTPGHIIPVLVGDAINGETDLPDVAQQIVKLAGKANQGDPWRCAAWTDILDDEGFAASPASCRSLAHRHGLPVITWYGDRFDYSGREPNAMDAAAYTRQV
jgi:3,4-dihydroxy 2-butanone 4-phosphate synthase/GTP cyclohydrolase II